MTTTKQTIEEITKDYFNAIEVVKIKGKTTVHLAVHGKNNHNQLVTTKDEGKTFDHVRSDAVLPFKKFVESCR